MRITSKGQVTIPQNLRERAGLMPGTDIEFVWDGAVVRLVKSSKDMAHKTRGEKLVERLKGVGKFEMTADEVVALMRGPPADEDCPK